MPFSKIELCEMDRRACLKVGALSLLGTVVGPHAQSAEANPPMDSNSNRQNSCIFILLQGGPSHIDLWDPKPRASREIRGPFQSISTATRGIRFGELLQESAKVSEELTVIRGVHHNFNNHIAGTYITLTGSDNQPNADREAHADDFPGPGAILNYDEKKISTVPRSISLPNWLSIPGPSNRMPGQYAGFLGSVYDPFLIKGDPNSAKYNPLALSLSNGMTAERFSGRIGLQQQLDQSARLIEQSLNKRHDSLMESAYRLVTDGRIRRALQVDAEKSVTRDAYGRNKFGQSLLVARRLVEAGVQHVSYNAFNQQWDTHGNLAARYKQLIPNMDRGFAALVADLRQRGLLETTLVINTGEFGRTPVMNKTAGRDHWPNAYSTVLCGGKIKRGFVFGQSDHHGAEVVENGVTPADVLATMWRHLGMDPQTELVDRLNRPFPISSGKVISEILS